jgi:DNA integrity scanning protein DisA with diadenylate cyclase activity
MEKQQTDHIIDSLFYGQIFLDSIESLSDKVFFKQKLKHLGKSFIAEMESTINSIYKNVRDKNDTEYITNIFDINYELLNKINQLDIFEKQNLINNFEKIKELTSINNESNSNNI